LTMLLAEQHVGLVKELASRVYALERGLFTTQGQGMRVDLTLDVSHLARRYSASGRIP
jgi:ABC-type branched-subunit amino acid transport system ATPase component